MALDNVVAYEAMKAWKSANACELLPAQVLGSYAPLSPMCTEIDDFKRALKYVEYMTDLDYVTDEAFGGIVWGDWQQGPPAYTSLSLPFSGVSNSTHDDKAESQITDLERRNEELCNFVAEMRPHRQVLRTAIVFLLFFSLVLTVQVFSSIPLIAPSLAWVGIAVSAFTILLCYLAALDWQDSKSGRAPSQ